MRRLGLLIAAIPLLALADLPARTVHDFRGKCGDCHLSSSGGKRILSREIDLLCVPCHGSLGLSHPTGMRPSIPLPAGFPADWNGRMTCATCHDVHGKGEYLLRTQKRGRAFCFLCHSALPGTHGGSARTAHTGSRPRGFEPARYEGSLDRVSADCLSCHDAMFSRVANARVGAGVYNHDAGGSHPIGVDYAKAYARGGFAHRSMIGPELALFDGKIGCGTCHNIYSRGKFLLSAGNERSALCLRCHRK